MPVDAMHAGQFVAHALGLKDVGYAVLVHPRLKNVAQAVRCQSGSTGSQDASVASSTEGWPEPSQRWPWAWWEIRFPRRRPVAEGPS